MTKQDIIDHLTDNCGLHRSSAIRAVEGVIGVISDSFARGENVYLRGFGTLEVKTTKEKKARNINAGTTLLIPAQRTVKFKLSNELKKRMNS